MAYVQPKTDNWLDWEYEDDPKLCFFNGCIGAIDGTYISAYILQRQQKPWRNRKGAISQNVFAAVRSDQCFSFVMAGAEGSIQDATLLNWACARGFRVPEDCFYVVDLGFGTRKGILLPFMGIRYHLQDWKDAKKKPQNAKELYNLRHVRVCTVVEQAFGGLKRKWKIVRMTVPEYDIEEQKAFIYAVTALHNFIIMDGWVDEDEEKREAFRPKIRLAREKARRGVQGKALRILRCKIAKKMWKDYQELH